MEKKKTKKVLKKATVRQRKALKIAMENNGNLSKAMKEAGYAPSTSKNPHLLKESEGWKELLKETVWTCACGVVPWCYKHKQAKFVHGYHNEIDCKKCWDERWQERREKYLDWK